jgi:hypothetical protein
MSAFRKLLNYPAVVASQWWRGGMPAVVKGAKNTLRNHLGIEELEDGMDQLGRKMKTVLPVTSTWVLTNWIESTALQANPLISVIMPTHNRCGLLRRATDSVRKQTYQNWEIVITDDGSTDGTAAILDQLRAELGADRVKLGKTSKGGCCAARNHALARALGEFIVYLDDDNIMHPLWMKAVVWAFSQRPDIDVVYGGLIVDDIRRIHGHGAGDLPTYYLHTFDRRHLAMGNLADIGQIAHRRELPEARFNESLMGVGDWDMLMRLTRDKDPLVLPVLACLYSTSAPDRLSVDPGFLVETEQVRQQTR